MLVPMSKKVFGENYENLLLLDSDTVVLQSIDPNIIVEAFLVAVKPEDEDHYSNNELTSEFGNMVYERFNVFKRDL